MCKQDSPRHNTRATLAMATVFWMASCWSHSVVAAKRLCDNTGEINNISVEKEGGSSIFSSAPNASEGASEEWVIDGKRNNFITVEFSQFNLFGPECGDNNTEYSTVRILTFSNEAANPYYLFCKGRRSPVGETMSSMGKIRIGYCHHFAQASVRFKVSTACSGTLIAGTSNTVISVTKRKVPCWIHLKSLGAEGIIVVLSRIVSSTAKNNKCQGSFISVNEMNSNGEESLLQDGKKRMCDISGSELLNENYTFFTRSQGINITYKKTTFRLSYRMFSQNESISSRALPDPEDVTTAFRNVSQGTMSDNIENQSNEGNGSITLIIALGCGGLFVIFVVIATLVFLKRRSARSGNRKNDAKRLRGNSAQSSLLVRTRSVGSINNAMYGQVVGGNGASDITERKKRERLSQLEEKYGPFPETAPSLRAPLVARKGTRPQMPLPRNANASTSANLYETIEEIQQGRVNTAENDENRFSYFSMTSEEFSEDEQPAISYDPVQKEENYATILDGPKVCYDKVGDEDKEQQLRIPVAEYISGPMPGKQVKYKRKKKKQVKGVDSCVALTPSVTPNETSKCSPMPNDKDTHYQTPNRAAQIIMPPVNSRATSHGIIAHVPKTGHSSECFAQRPSLPEINRCKGETSSTNSLQQDAENYLKPRPSCPDAIIACAYSSSEDLSEMRRRLLAAAHPSLLDENTCDSIENESNLDATVNYDSPRPSVGNELIVPSAIRYASPRRKQNDIGKRRK